MLQLARFTHIGSRSKYTSIMWRPPRRRSRSKHQIVIAALVLLCAAMAGAMVWIAAGGDFQSVAAPLLNWIPLVDASTYEPPSDGVAVHVATNPTGADVLVDGRRAGKAPALLAISRGMHVLTLRDAKALDATEAIDVVADPMDLTIPLWSRKPQVAPLRPNFPGASLLDARWLANGQVILALGVGQPGATGSSARELWRFDPTSGQMQRVLPPAGTAPSILTLSPDAKRLAYASSSSSSALPQDKAANTVANAGSTSQAVMIAEQGGRTAPESIFELPASSPGVTTSERITDLVWTPDSQHLVAMTRVGDSPGRSRIILLDLGGFPDSPASASSPVQLALLPAEIVPGSASVDPGSHWLATIAHAASAPGGRDVVSLLAVELRAGGAVRDVGDLGSSDRLAAAAPVAWAPAGPHGVFHPHVVRSAGCRGRQQQPGRTGPVQRFACHSAATRLVHRGPQSYLTCRTLNRGVSGPPAISSLHSGGPTAPRWRSAGCQTHSRFARWTSEVALSATLVSNYQVVLRRAAVRPRVGTRNTVECFCSIIRPPLSAPARRALRSRRGWCPSRLTRHRRDPEVERMPSTVHRGRIALRFCVVLLPVVLTLLGPIGAYAQTTGNSGSGDCFLGICDPAAWLRDLVPQIVASFLGGLISGIGGAITQFPDDVNFLTRTPERLSYDNDLVKLFITATRALANGLLVVVTLIGGFNVIFRPYLGSSYAGALELAPRLLLGAILANTAPWWGRLANRRQ